MGVPNFDRDRFIKVLDETLELVSGNVDINEVEVTYSDGCYNTYVLGYDHDESKRCSINMTFEANKKTNRIY